MRLGNMRRHLLFVVNPKAGSQGKLAQIEDHLAVLGVQVSRFYTKSKEHSIEGLAAKIEELRLEKKRPVDTVVALGGDGTVRDVVCGLRPLLEKGQDLTLAVVPRGTANVLAEDLKIPRCPRKIAEMLAFGDVKRLSVPTIDDQPFVMMAGCGCDAWVVARLNKELKRKWGRIAFWPPFIRLIKELPTMNMHVKTDTKNIVCASVLFFNGQRYAGSFIVAKDGNLFQDEVYVLAVRQLSRKILLKMALALPFGKMASLKEVSLFKATQISVEQTELSYQTDGDVGGKAPLRLTAGTFHVPLIVPESYGKSNGWLSFLRLHA